jgi:hypothetical protein
MDFAITGKQIKATSNPLYSPIATPAKTTNKRPVSKPTQPVNKAKPVVSSKASSQVKKN